MIVEAKMEDIRKEIDKIDETLCKLYEKRMNLVLEIAVLKKERGAPVFDEKREADVLEKGMHHLQNHQYEEGYHALLQCLMAHSKVVQEKWLSENS